MAYQLKNWAVVSNQDSYTPPECVKLHLSGEVYGRDPRASDGKEFPDGKKVYTSSVKDIDGRLITTRSGSVYELVGDPDPEYLEFLKEIGRVYDPVNPIKVISYNDVDPELN